MAGQVYEFFIYFILFVVVASASAAKVPATRQPNVCNTTQCQISSEMLKSCMNFSVDPCTDFYEYACGNFAEYRKHMYDEDSDDAYDWMSEMEKNITNSVKEFLKSNINKYDSAVVKKTQIFYKYCTDTDMQNENGLEPIKEILFTIGVKGTAFGKSQPEDSNFKWFEAAAKLKRVLDIDFIIAPKVIEDPLSNASSSGSPARTYFALGTPPSCMSFIDSRISQSSTNAMKAMSKLFTSIAFRNFALSVSDILEQSYGKGKKKIYKYLAEEEVEELGTFFEKKKSLCMMMTMATMFTDDDEYYERISFDQFLNMTEKRVTKGNVNDVIDWRKYIKTLYRDIDDVTLDFNTLEILAPKKKSVLKSIVTLIEETSPRILQLAIWFEAVAALVPFTTDELRALDANFREGGLESPIKSWEDDVCNRLVQENLGLAILHHMLDDGNVVDNQNQARDMIADLKTSLEIVIGSSEWMDNVTQATATEKIRAMKSQVSHPTWLQNDTLLAMYYDDVEIKRDDFLRTLTNFYQSRVRRNLRCLAGEPSLDLELSAMENPMMVNAFYDPTENQITIPYGIMQRTFFGHPLRALNYGGLGLVIGHEVTHGFDTTGSKYDKTGELNNWWANDTLSKYQKRTHCFIDSYNNITVGDMNRTVNGRLTLDENIADNGGMREVLIAYRHYVKINGQEPLLVGFENFTHEQLLSLSFGNIWCQRTTPKSLISSLRSEHAPHEGRVQGVFINSQELADIWKCPKGSPMNPETKCRVW